MRRIIDAIDKWWLRASPEAITAAILLPWIALYALAFFLGGCGHREPEKPAAQEALEPVAAMFDDYLAWSHALLSTQAQHVTLDCDDTLFTSLRATYEPDADPTDALIEKGRWGRRPAKYGPCEPNETSRDMAIGEAVWMETRGRADLAADVLDYVDAHGGRLGNGDEAHTGIRTPLYATYLKIAGRHQPEEHTPIVVGGELGYERHIAAWHLIARADAEGGLREGYHDWIRATAEAQPQNPLFQYMLAAYVTGDWAPYVAAATDARYFPREHLPTSGEVCEPWVIQRDMGKDWEACKGQDGQPAPFKQFSGSDWLAVAARALKRTLKP